MSCFRAYLCACVSLYDRLRAFLFVYVCLYLVFVECVFSFVCVVCLVLVVMIVCPVVCE